MLQLGYLQEVKKGIHTSNIGFLTRYEATKKLISLFTEEQISTLPVLNKFNLNTELIRLRLRNDAGQSI